MVDMKQLIKEAVNKNIMVTDRDSSEISNKLVWYMWESCGETMHTLYAPSNVYPKTHFESKLLDTLGITIIRDERLNMGGEFTKYFENDLSGCFPWESDSLKVPKESLLLGVGDGDSVILGCV